MLVFVALLAADEALVYFDDAVELRPVRRPQLQASRKRCSMNHADFWVTPISLPSCRLGDALACGYEQVHGVEPLVQGNMAALKDCACTDREIKLDRIAAVKSALALW